MLKKFLKMFRKRSPNIVPEARSYKKIRQELMPVKCDQYIGYQIPEKVSKINQEIEAEQKYKKKKQAVKLDDRWLQNEDEIKKVVLELLANQGNKGFSVRQLNQCVVSSFLESEYNVVTLSNEKYVRDTLYGIYSVLRSEEKIWFRPSNRTWVIKKQPSAAKRKASIFDNFYIRDVNQKERVFLRENYKIKGNWKYIKSEDVFSWLHSFLSQGSKNGEAFERFCCCLLEHYYVSDVKITKKRAVSGADGGVDGVGIERIDNVEQGFAFEAKCYAPDRQVGEDIVAKFSFVLGTKLNYKHGCIITTGTFSDRAEKAIKKAENTYGYKIISIDKYQIIDMMCNREGRYSKGLGLFKTDDYGIYYLNEDMLLHEISRHRPEIIIEE